MVNHARRWTPVAEHPEPTPDALALVSGALLSTHEAAERLRCSRPTLWRLIGSGKLAAIQERKGTRVLIAEGAIEAYLAANLKQR